MSLNMNTNYQKFYATYAEKLQSPLWQEKRLEVFKRDDFTCVSCDRDKQQLHNAADSLQVHHLKYFWHLDPWEYEMKYLITYCRTCHETEHLIGDDLRDIFIELLNAHPLYVRPLAQVNTLVEKYPPFYKALKELLNDYTIHYLQSKAA